MQTDPLELNTLPRRIGDLPRYWAATTPNNEALCQGECRWTWLEFVRAIDDAKELLVEKGVRPGDRVVVLCENDRVVPTMLFAITDCDAWAVIVNARLSPREVDVIIDHCQPRRVVYTTRASSNAAAHAKRHRAAPATTASLGGFDIGPLNETCQTEAVYDHADEQIAVLVYTSGTTGAPKGVMLSHQNLSYTARAAGGMRETSSADSLYLVLPMAHIFGLSSCFLALVTVGGSVELSSRFDPAHIVGALARGITMFSGAPLMFSKILEHCETNKLPLEAPKIRYISAGGAPLDFPLKRKVDKAFGVPLNNGYGITECSPTVSLTVNGDPRNDDTVGYLMPGVEAKIIDEGGKPLPHGEVGTICIRGVSVMKGYYRAPDKTAEVIDEEGWYHTGDMARFGEDNCLYIVGRSKELIIRSGFNVYPIEVESVICGHASVSAAAVVGRAVPGNEEVVAYVQLEPGRSVGAEDIRDFLRDKLAAYKQPEHVIILDSLPYSATGKVMKAELIESAKQIPFKAD